MTVLATAKPAIAVSSSRLRPQPAVAALSGIAVTAEPIA